MKVFLIRGNHEDRSVNKQSVPPLPPLPRGPAAAAAPRPRCPATGPICTHRHHPIGTHRQSARNRLSPVGMPSPARARAHSANSPTPRPTQDSPLLGRAKCAAPPRGVGWHVLRGIAGTGSKRSAWSGSACRWDCSAGSSSTPSSIGSCVPAACPPPCCRMQRHMHAIKPGCSPEPAGHGSRDCAVHELVHGEAEIRGTA